MRTLVPPPYGVAPVRFRFRALAAQAARAPLGGAREVAFGCLMAARLAASLPDMADLNAAARADRAASARAWFAAVAIPSPLRAALVRVANASTRGNRGDTAAALTAVLSITRRQLDAASIAELDLLLREIRRESTA